MKLTNEKGSTYLFGMCICVLGIIGVLMVLKECYKWEANESKVNVQELQAQAKKETELICPRCSVNMKKEILEEGKGIAVDRCPKCTGAFLGEGELETLQGIAKRKASSSNGLGLIWGMAISSLTRR